ncbi:response regulator transcription factor [Dyella koreensis]|uniref:Response regulator transcription factor n=1 Tax=Dyella koreensis TaxID=311235 RepID=A0ABW8K583_9GAMM
MPNILLVEDDRMLADAIATALRQDGWQVDCARDAAAARIALTDHAYTAALLDLGLPQGSGLDVLRAMRERYDTTPALIITARDQLGDRIRGLDAGADDYLVKPFQIDELLARLRAVIRRSEGRVTPVLSWKGITIDPARRTVMRDGVNVRLGTHEYRTLLALMERQGRAVARDLLEDLIYGGSGSIESNTIAVYVHQLRRKLGDDVIATVHGYGYRLGEER